MPKTAAGEQKKLSTALSGIAGEYYVAAELSRQGFIAAVTLRNTRGVDILVSRPGGKRSASIQVKTLQTGRTEWLLDKSDETSKGENHYYVFVALNGRDGHPEFYVVQGEYVASCCAATHLKYLNGRKKDGSPRKDTNMRVFRPRDEHRNQWDGIRLD